MTYLDPIRQAASEFAPPPQQAEDNHFADLDKEDPALKPQQASMVSPYDPLDKEAPTGDEPAPGSLKRTVREFARGPYRAVLGLGGAIADIGPALFQGKEMTTGPKLVHDLGLDRPEDATWYEKGADVAGQLLPGMVAGVGISGKVLPTIVQDLAASQVFGPLGEKIGTKLGLAPGRAQALGIGASVLGSGGTATGVNRVLGRVKPPTGEAILNSAQNGYSKVENMPITWRPNAIADNVTAPLKQRMENSGADITASTAYRMLGKLEPTEKEIDLFGGVGLGRLWGVQKNLKELAKQTDATGHYTSDAHWAGETVKSINQFLESAKDNPEWIASAPGGLTPPAAGMTRFFRGETPNGSPFAPNLALEPGSWWSTDLNTARRYGPNIKYVDVDPKGMMGVAQDANHPREPSFILDKSLWQNAKPYLDPRAQAAQELHDVLSKANQDYSSAMWDDTFGKAYDKAKLRASTVTTGGNLPNNVRQEFAKFLDPFHPARSLGLRPDELAQVNQIARGRNVTQNILRGIGGVAPESKLGLYAQAAGLGAAMGGNPGGLMLPAVGVAGSLAKRASNKMQKGQIENLRNTVRARSALAQSMRNAEPGSGGEAGEAAEAGLAGILGEEAPEWVNRAAGAGADTGANAEKEKKAEDGGYAMGHRLLKAVGYSGGAFGGYDNPQGEQFADPQAFQLMIARQAARPQTTVGGGVPFPQQAIGGGAVPQPNYRVGGYDWKGANSYPQITPPAPSQSKYLFGSFSTVSKPHPPKGGSSMQAPQDDDEGGGYDDSRMPVSRNVVDRRSYDESKLHWPWTISANERRFYPQGDPVFEAPILPPPVYTGKLGGAAGINDIPGPAPTVGATGMMNASGGYDGNGLTGLLHNMAAPIVAEHSQPWNMGRLASVLGQALGTMGAGAPESTPPLSDVISPTQFGATKANPLLAPQYSTGKSDRLPVGNVPWPQVPGGYVHRRRARGGYGMGQVSPLAGGGGF